MDLQFFLKLTFLQCHGQEKLLNILRPRVIFIASNLNKVLKGVKT